MRIGSRHIIASEYPPDLGGVADFAAVLSDVLPGEVHVWAPGVLDAPADSGASRAVVHRVMGRFDRASLDAAGRQLDECPAPRQLFVQWVPHGFGRRSMNLRFCLWILRRARKGDSVQLFVHEPFLSDVHNVRQLMVAAVHRLMIFILLRASSRVLVSIPAWADALRPYLGKKRAELFPLPARITEVDDSSDLLRLRSQLSRGRRFVVGHFGACGGPMLPILARVVPRVLAQQPDAVFVLMGRGSAEAREKILEQDRSIDERLIATGPLSARDASLHLQACEVLVQPYPDGVSGRRTSLIAALRNGVAAVSTSGHLTESFWARSGAVELVPVTATDEMVGVVSSLLGDAAGRAAIAGRAREFYEEKFSARRLAELFSGE